MSVFDKKLKEEKKQAKKEEVKKHSINVNKNVFVQKCVENVMHLI